MFEAILRFALRYRWAMLATVAVMLVLGVSSYQQLPIDAVPDITNVQVQINTEAAGYSPMEVEQRVTFPVETLMAGLPGLETTRSLSRYGLSQVTVIFEDGTDLHFARQLVGQKIGEVASQLPAGIEATMGPIATGLGEISQFIIDDGALPIAPHLYLPQLIDETTRREQALALCLELLATCDEVRVFGDLVTEGMERELREAKRLGIHAHFVREVRA